MQKIILLIFVPGLLLALGFALWGDWFEGQLQASVLTEKLTGQPQLGVPLLLGLLVGDLFLPIPATSVMAAAAMLYGFLPGLLIAFSGLLLSGCLGYGCGRIPALRRRLLSTEEQSRYQAFFDRRGTWAIILSRPFPILPEVVSLLAGFSGMSFRRFFTVLCCSSLPLAALCAWGGEALAARPVPLMLASAGVPLLLWLLCRHLFTSK